LREKMGLRNYCPSMKDIRTRLKEMKIDYELYV
jgi:hypothetical protein